MPRVKQHYKVRPVHAHVIVHVHARYASNSCKSRAKFESTRENLELL